MFLISSSYSAYKPGGKKYAWDGKGRGFESDLDMFLYLYQIKLSAYYLSADALLPHLRIFLCCIQFSLNLF